MNTPVPRADACTDKPTQPPLTVAQAWLRLSLDVCLLLDMLDRPDFSLHCDNSHVVNRWCAAVERIRHARDTLNAQPEEAMRNWRVDPLRTRYRGEDDSTRLLVHLLRNKRRHSRISHNDAAAILEEHGLDEASILRLLGEFIDDEEAEPTPHFTRPPYQAHAIPCRCKAKTQEECALRHGDWSFALTHDDEERIARMTREHSATSFNDAPPPAPPVRSFLGRLFRGQ